MQGSIDRSVLFAAQDETQRARCFPDLPGSFSTTQRCGDAVSMDRPIHHQLRDRATGRSGDTSQFVHKVLVFLPLVTLKHGVFGATIAGRKNVLTRQFARQEPFHQGPVDH